MRRFFFVLLCLGCSETADQQADYLRRQYVTECSALNLMQRTEDVVKATPPVSLAPGGDRDSHELAISIWKSTQEARLNRLNKLTTEQMARIERLEQQMESAIRR